MRIPHVKMEAEKSQDQVSKLEPWQSRWCTSILRTSWPEAQELMFQLEYKGRKRPMVLIKAIRQRNFPYHWKANLFVLFKTSTS